MKTHTADIHRLVRIAILSAIAVVVMQFEIPLWFAPAFYKLDFSEVVVLIGGFALGPVAGIVIELLKNLLKVLIFSSSTAYVGELANFLMGCAFVLPAVLLYRKSPKKKTAIIGLLLGTLILAVTGALLNRYLLIPTYSVLYALPMESILAMGTAVNKHIDSVWTLILFAVVPFNLFKGFAVGIVTVLLYKRISPILK